MSMASAKGREYEKLVLDRYLKQVWPKVYRPRLKGQYDYGDFAGVGGWLIEAKHRKTWRLSEWIRTAREKVARAENQGRWAIIMRSDGRSLPGDFVVVEAETFFELLKERRDDG